MRSARRLELGPSRIRMGKPSETVHDQQDDPLSANSSFDLLLGKDDLVQCGSLLSSGDGSKDRNMVARLARGDPGEVTALSRP